MKNRRVSRSAVAIAAIAMGLTYAAAQTHPNFSGTWKLNESLSGTKPGEPREIVFNIEHKDPAFKYTATGKRGVFPFSETYSFTTDGKPPADPSKVGATGIWEGQSLVMRYMKDGKEFAKYKFSLTAEGRQMIREGSVGSNAYGKQIYDRQ